MTTSHPKMTAHSRRITDHAGVVWDALVNYGRGVHAAVPKGSPSGTPIRFVIDAAYVPQEGPKRKSKTEDN